MTLNIKNILSLLVPEYAITLFTFVSIGLVLGKAVSWIFLAPFVVYLLTLFGFNVINQVWDVKMDILTKPKRVLPSRRVTLGEAKGLALFLFGLSGLGALALGLLLPWLVFIGSIVLYSHPKLFLRRFVFSTPLFGLFFYVICPFLFVATFFNTQINYLFLLFFSLITAFVSVLKDIEDIKAEKKFGLKSVPGAIGEGSTLRLSFFGLLSTTLLFGLLLSSSNLIFGLIGLICLAVVFVCGTIALSKQYFGKFLSSSKALVVFMGLVVFIELAFGLGFLFI